MHLHIPKSYKWVIGIDEVGRGPIAGPVTIGFCVVRASFFSKIKREFSGINDSKKLSARKREYFYGLLMEHKNVIAHTVSISAQKIEKDGIAYAISYAIRKGLENAIKINPQKCFVLLDGTLRAPDSYIHQKTVIRGDSLVPIISAASIIAKVTRDAYMTRQHKKYLHFGFNKNKGYGTKNHYNAIRRYGLTPLHRKSWIR